MTAPNGSLLSAPPEVRGKRVLVYSLGIEGRDLAGWLLANGATVVISDTRSDEALAAAGAHAPGRPPPGLRRATARPVRATTSLPFCRQVLRYNPALQRARELRIR